MEKTPELHTQLFLSLMRVGVQPTMETFPDRKRIQKLVYLMQKIGIEFEGKPNYFQYNWHIHGPYSPKLTEVMFDVLERGHNVDLNAKLDSKTEKKLDTLGLILIKNKVYSIEQLELLTSLFYLQSKKSDYGISRGFKSAVIDALARKKPQFSKNQIQKSWKILEEIKKIEQIT